MKPNKSRDASERYRLRRMVRIALRWRRVAVIRTVQLDKFRFNRELRLVYMCVNGGNHA